MNIAALVVCYNDGYKINEWEENYQFYKDSLYRLIIIDNGSEKQFINEVKRRFTEATIIENGENRGCTGAYNAGIKLALDDKNVDAIMLIGNDMKIVSQSVIKLAAALENDKEIGMVSPVLLNKDSQIIADAGCELLYNFVMRPRCVGQIYKKEIIPNKFSMALTGGMNLASRKFYEEVGLQDETLFMYSDEADMGIRAYKKGFKLKVIPDAVAWHQHINPQKRERRLPYSSYLIVRNKVYLGRKHYGKLRSFNIFLYFIIQQSLLLLRNKLKRRNILNEKYALLGAWNGLKGDMKIPESFQLY